MKHLHEFGSLCYILNDREPIGKFDEKSDDSVFLGYYSNSRAYRVYNKRTMVVMESINVRVDDYLPPIGYSRPEGPLLGSFHKEWNTLNILKDALSSR